jgi:Mrp family chromosome partitioning ATPase
LIERKRTVESELQDLVNENIAFEKVLIQMDEFDGKIGQEIFELAKLEERMTDLSRERSTIGEGRIRFPISDALPAFAPTKDKRITATIGGFVGGWIASIAFFFALGTTDQKTFGVCQLKSGTNNLHVLGVLPNLDEAGGESESVMLASDCIHRIRSRVEARRAPESGYALMVSSPFQGDGKTTLAVSLAWSYAESGYRTLIIDADFVGRAMTHQFGRLKESGLREVIRNGVIADEIIELGHPNLRLLGVGFDRRVSAANVSPTVFSRVLESVREDFDIIIFDSGPFTASIEAYPLAAVADGIILTLRRGRSRIRLMECVKDIRSIGTDYLGVVLNYADKTDCQRYGSTSKVSENVAQVLGSEGIVDGDIVKHPLIGDLAKRDGELDDR